MFLRTFFFAFLAVGALAVKPKLSGQYRESIKNMLTTVCNITTGGDAEEKAEQLTNSLQSFYDCLYTNVDIDALPAEIKNATADGTLDDVFKKYCAKTPELKTCFHTLIDAARPCVMESAKNQLLVYYRNITDQSFDYICYNDGNRIKHFMNEKGFECLASKRTEIKVCDNNQRAKFNNSLEYFLSSNMEENCRIFDTANTCLLNSLKTCTPPTPGFLIEDLVKYMHKGSMCDDVLSQPQ